MLRLFLWLRVLLLVAALGMLVCGVLMFGLGGKKLVDALRLIAGAGDAKAIGASVMGAADAFLFGVALFVIAAAIAFGFAADAPAELRSRLPGWMQAQDLGQLKRTLVEVVLVVLVVDFATDLAEADAPLDWNTLVLPLSVLLIAGALRLGAADHHRPD